MTSKTDNPPPYEETLPYPRYGNFPQWPQQQQEAQQQHQQQQQQQQQQGPSYPPPPSYTPGPGYWGQPVMVAAPGYPQSGIVTLSMGVPSPNAEMRHFQSTQWDSTGVRHAFIRKVYLILAAQLVVTLSVVAVFTFVEPVRLFVIKYPVFFWASFVVYFVVYAVLVCVKETARRFPWNLVLLGVFTVAMSYMAGTISSYYTTKAVFLAIGITGVICVAVTIFCFQTKVDFTTCGGLLCIASILLLVLGIVTAIVLSFQYVPWLHMLYAAIGAIVFTLFLVYNTQLLIGDRKLALSPEEYTFGALSLYVDIVQIFLFVLLFGDQRQS